MRLIADGRALVRAGFLGRRSQLAGAVALLLAACGTSDPAGRGPERAVADLDLYPGLEATLFASEPVLSNPTNIDVDHRGRVWVCDVENYREHARNDLRPEGDRILILEDEDGDGVADTNKVYYQGRDIDAALGISVLGNKVIVTAAPHVVVFTDEDGDDIPDSKEHLFVNAGSPQDDHSTHSISFGPDGKYYWNMGNNGDHIHDREGKLVVDASGNAVLDRNHVDALRERPADSRPDFAEAFLDMDAPYQGGMVFRCNTDGSGMEVLANNFRNNYEVAVDSLGGVWQSDNDDDGNYACRINYILEHGNYGYRDEITGARNQVARTGMHEEVPERHWHQNDPGVVPNLVITGAGAPTGVTAYEGRLLPKEFWDQVLSADSGPGVVRGIVATKAGAGYTAEVVNLLKGERDKWVRPVDVAIAPDGSVFVSDWYDPVIGWNRQEDSARGRIFRVAPSGHEYRPEEPSLASLEDAREALKSPNYAVRYLAWNMLAEAGGEAEDILTAMFVDSGNLRHRARALWLLARIEERGEHHIRSAMKDPEEDIRIVALRAAKRRGTNIIPLVAALVDDPSAHVRRECAILLRGHSSAKAASLWARLAEQHVAGDRWSIEALGIGADGNWDAYLRAWQATAHSQRNTPAAREIVWRSRAATTPAALVEILGDPSVESARFLRAFDFQPDSAAKVRALRRLAFQTAPDGTAYPFGVAAEALLRLPTLDLQGDAGIRASVETLLGRGVGTEQYARLVQRYALADRYPSLLEIAARNNDNPIGISSARTLLAAGAVATIQQFIKSNPDLTADVVQAVANTRSEEAVPLVSSVLLDESQPPQVRDLAVRSLARFNFGQAALVAIAERGDFPADVAPIAGAALARSMNVRLRERAAELFPEPSLREGQELPQMTDLLVLVGNAERGAEVFEEATCLDCHVVNGNGTTYGPDLSEIGSKLSKAGVYEAILDPSGGVAPQFRLEYLHLDDGQEVFGFVEDESGPFIRLRTEGGIVDEIPKARVTDRRVSSVSAMPDDLQEQLSVDDLVDLVEYVVELR